MSWETNKITLTNALKVLGYSEVERNIDIERNPDSLDHFNFTLDPLNPETRNVTSKSLLTSDRIELKIAYKVKDKETKETLYDKFRTVMSTINALTICVGIDNGSVSFIKKSRNDNKYIGTVRFYIGVQSC